MDRKGRIQCAVLNAISYIIILSGCVAYHDSAGTADIEIRLCGCTMEAKSHMPDEELISDVNLLIFDGHGRLERHIYMDNGNTSFNVSLLKGCRYSIYACANFGYRIDAGSIEEAGQLCYHLAYPDEYREGMPMSATLHGITIDEEKEIRIELERLMARISIRMDRSRLEDGVQIEVTGIRIGNCPKKVTVFGSSRVESPDDCFSLGFNHYGDACIPLNRCNMLGISDNVSLYMLENIQGNFNETGPDTDEQKVFAENDPRKEVCSYIEIEMEYTGREFSSGANPLIYRFYLGEDINSLDIERNCHYHITICPENDGLQGDGWRVDKTGLTYTGLIKFLQYPSDYIIGDIGDRIHIGCRFTPSFAPFDIGLEYLEEDRARGIYEYELDADGHGVTLTLTGPGCGLIYMEAGEPVNDAALFMIEVNLPEDTWPYTTCHMKQEPPEYLQIQALPLRHQPQDRDL